MFCYPKHGFDHTWRTLLSFAFFVVLTSMFWTPKITFSFFHGATFLSPPSLEKSFLPDADFIRIPIFRTRSSNIIYFSQKSFSTRSSTVPSKQPSRCLLESSAQPPCCQLAHSAQPTSSWGAQHATSILIAIQSIQRVRVKSITSIKRD